MCSDCVPPSTPGQRLDRGAHDVVERLLGGQRHARGLRVEPHQPRLRVLGAERLAQLARPDPPRRAVLGDLLEEVDVRVEEEAQPRRERVDVEPARDLLLDVGEAVLEREGQLLRRGRARLADVVAGDADRVPARQLARAPLHHVAQQAHRLIDREAPLLLGDVLLEDVGLDRPAQPVARHARLLGRHHVERHHDRRRRVDRHRHRDLAEVDAAEQRLHVVERVDRHALAPDLAERARVVGVVAHQRRHVERRAQAGLPVVEQVAEALVGLLGGPEAGELAHRPQPAAVHARVHAARERRLAREPDPLLERADVLRRVERSDRLTRERRERRLALRGRRIALAIPALRIRSLN